MLLRMSQLAKKLYLRAKNIPQDRALLLAWYQQNKRALPWRTADTVSPPNTPIATSAASTTKTTQQTSPTPKDPYKIWISEVMLQQTTVTAVIPYYEKFLARFPDVESLAQSKIEDVYEYWAGLGYYSRARNLHKAAQQIYANQKTHQGFPQSYQQLLELPGFGPYTARAVSSLAFGEKVGVLDGNVIRVLSRKYGIDSNWWEPKERQKLQDLADQLAQTDQVSDLNQALMELGATICTPKKVMCLLCPWKKTCISLKENKIATRPRAKKRPDFEIWNWNFEIQTKKINGTAHIYLQENTATPFLKNNWLPPSNALKGSTKPNKEKYHFKHGVTKYEIFVSIKNSNPKSTARPKSGKWFPLAEITKTNPTSLMKKIITQISKP